jgi:Fur family transcriptional regulator, ferric uptake regulator
VKQLRNTKQRQIVLETVLEHCDHPTADQIYFYVRKKDEKISRGTVYRNLNILSEEGEILHVKVPGVDRFDSRQDLHYHLLCSECGKLTDLADPYDSKLDRKIARESGYQISRHRLIFEGICPECQKKEAAEKQKKPS